MVSYFSSYFDNILVGILNGAFALGLFERAFKLVLQPLGQITAPLGRVAMPMLSRMQQVEDAYRRAFLKMLQLVLLITAPGMLCATILSRDVVFALLGPTWAGTAPILQWLSIAGAVSVYTIASCWLLTTQGRVREQMHCGLISSALILVSLLCGIHWGPVGIAASYAAFAPVVHGTYVWVSTRRGPVSLGQVAGASMPVWFTLVVSLPVLLLVRHALHVAPLLKVLVGAAAAYLGSLFVLACLPSGRRLLSDLWGMRRLLART